MKKIILIGDSFVENLTDVNNLNKRYGFKTWVQLILDNVKDYQVIVDGQSSRDVQTIIDKWILSLNKINSDDILIICIPTFYRTRLPLKEENWSVREFEDFKIINKFIGANLYKEGDSHFDSFNHSGFKLNIDMINIYQVLNSTKSAITNYLEIIESLKKLTPCYTYLFSWDEISKNDEIEDKKILIKEMGTWETLHEVYEKTNGEYGVQSDQHWSEKTNKLFYNYLINNKLKNFNL